MASHYCPQIRRRTIGVVPSLKAVMPKTSVPLSCLSAATLTVVLLLSLSACATTPAPADSRMSAHWQLDSAASDNVETKVAQVISSAKVKLRKRRSYGGRHIRRQRRRFRRREL